MKLIKDRSLAAVLFSFTLIVLSIPRNDKK